MAKIALVIIDMQKAYFHNDALAERRDELVDNANQLIGWATELSMPIFNVVTQHKKDRSTWTLNMLDDGQGYLFEGDDDAATVDGLVTDGTVQIIKTRDSAFYRTDFLEHLRNKDIDTLILLGVSTHSCIMLTAADAYAENIKVVLARDAIASHDPQYHESTLALLTQEYRQPQLSNDEIHQIMQHPNSQAGLREGA